MPWLIHSKQESDFWDEPMYWSDEMGWVSIEDATRYTDRDREGVTYMPIPDGAWIQEEVSCVDSSQS